MLYSQASTFKIIIPVALALGVPMITIMASIPAAGALFILPTYPTVVAATDMDDTGSTKIGKYVLNHSFMIPGLVTILAGVLTSYGLASLVL